MHISVCLGVYFSIPVVSTRGGGPWSQRAPKMDVRLVSSRVDGASKAAMLPALATLSTTPITNLAAHQTLSLNTDMVAMTIVTLLTSTTATVSMITAFMVITLMNMAGV